MEEIAGGRMPLMEHFRELRKRVFRAAAFIASGSLIGFIFYAKIVDKLAQPICDLHKAQATGSSSCGVLYINGVLGPINLQIRVALLTGVILSAPFWLYQIWAFIAPGLHRKERRYSVAFVCVAVPFFGGGAYLGYRLLPTAVKVLLGFTPHSLNNLVKFDDYLDFVLRLIFVFGAAFELPVFLVALNLIGAVSGRSILKPWRFAIFGITFFAAAFTPTADPITMMILAVPLYILYFMAGGIALLNDRRKSRRKVDE